MAPMTCIPTNRNESHSPFVCRNTHASGSGPVSSLAMLNECCGDIRLIAGRMIMSLAEMSERTMDNVRYQQAKSNRLHVDCYHGTGIRVVRNGRGLKRSNTCTGVRRR